MFRATWMRIYAVLGKVRPMYRYGVSALLLLFLLGAWRTVILGAMSEKLSHYQTEVANLEKHIELLEDIKRNNSLLNRAIGDLKGSLAIQPAGHQHSLGSNIDFVFKQAAQSGVMIGMCLPQEESDQGWCLEHKIFFDFDGTFDGIKRFFDEIAKQKRMIRCSRLYITKQDTGHLKAACILNFYTSKPKLRVYE